MTFLVRLYERMGSAIALPLAFVVEAALVLALGLSKFQSFNNIFFYVMGKALTGKLSYTRTGLVYFVQS